MRCKHCNARLANHDIWCVECGRQSDVVKTELSAMKSLKKTYKAFLPEKALAIPGTAFMLIAGVLPILVLLWVFNKYISLESGTAMQMLMNLGIKSIAISVFIPIILSAFNAMCSHTNYQLSFSSMMSSLKSYPRYLGYALISALFFSIIYIIGFGFPSFASLPILRLVWIVLVNYWVAIVLPAVVLMEQFSLSPWQAIKKSYRHFHDLRWNIYYLALVLGIINLVALLLLFVPLIFTLPLSMFAIRDYTRLLVEYELLDYRR
ncbi:MAG: hypothetical protein CVU50_08370 [Candidatus Cloacimonetes bacterium HGW-Cloacimonetes-3]|jgi:hypothetical protein|nr:MAG: hypothetical protein CVU50_08370 [Candidatus Cloacimonetes bacterium HGW-Cloacimonetes-3]